MSKPISESQFEFGIEIMKKFAKKYSLNIDQAVAIISDIPKTKDCYEWVNIDRFFLEYANGRRQ